MKRIILIIVSVILLFINCNKNSNTLTGDYCVANINGQSWQAGCSGISGGNCLSAEWSDSGKSLTINAENDGPQNIFLGLADSVNRLISGTYILNSTLKKNCAAYQNYNKSYRYAYNTDAANTGIISITFDSIHSRVYGTFSFKAIYDLDSEVVNVTAGKFSLPCRID